jgi:hypothetical protein
MTWHVQYCDGEMERIERHPSPEMAIEFACRLIEEGRDVYGIGTGSLDESITREEIARIYVLWVRAKYPFGIRAKPSAPAAAFARPLQLSPASSAD